MHSVFFLFWFDKLVFCIASHRNTAKQCFGNRKTFRQQSRNQATKTNRIKESHSKKSIDGRRLNYLSISYWQSVCCFHFGMGWFFPFDSSSDLFFSSRAFSSAAQYKVAIVGWSKASFSWKTNENLLRSRNAPHFIIGRLMRSMESQVWFWICYQSWIDAN